MAKFKVDEAVQQKMPAPFKGKVVQVAIVENDLGYKVQAPDGSERYFTEAQLEAATAS